MSGGVFVLKDKNTLLSMSAAEFVSEDDFQQLLSQFPELLSGDQINPTQPRRWALVKREISIPSEANGSGRWSLDHLFLDQDGVPTLVEVKRQSDTRIRREVVGQMLDYAANCVVYWPTEQLRIELEATCEREGRTTTEVLTTLLGSEADIEGFWIKVKTNLEAGRIRMLFVADAIPSELARIIEFLNIQMNPAEVLGVELRQFEGQGLKTIVPRIVGQTQAATQRRNGSIRVEREWDEEAIFDVLKSRCTEKEVLVANKIAEWMKRNADHITFGAGIQDGSMYPWFRSVSREDFYPMLLWSYGKVEIQFKLLSKRTFLSSLERRQELQRQLNSIAGVSIKDIELTQRPNIPLKMVTDDPGGLEKLFRAMDWVVEKSRDLA